jgi:hypothetical protein
LPHQALCASLTVTRSRTARPSRFSLFKVLSARTPVQIAPAPFRVRTRRRARASGRSRKRALADFQAADASVMHLADLRGDLRWIRGRGHVHAHPWQVGGGRPGEGLRRQRVTGLSLIHSDRCMAASCRFCAGADTPQKVKTVKITTGTVGCFIDAQSIVRPSVLSAQLFSSRGLSGFAHRSTRTGKNSKARRLL